MAVKTRRVIEIPDTVKVNADEIAHSNGNGNGYHIKTVVIKPKRKNPLERVLTRAIDGLKTRGWITGHLTDQYDGGGMCLVGALQFGASGDPRDTTSTSQRVSRHVYKFLPKSLRDETEDAVVDGLEYFDMEAALMEWNDSFAENRGQVLRLLRRALKAIQ